MPDWKAVLLERMESLGLCPAQEEEIASELAGHVEDCYKNFEHKESASLKPSSVVLNRWATGQI
jgi:hypothetical protein